MEEGHAEIMGDVEALRAAINGMTATSSLGDEESDVRRREGEKQENLSHDQIRWGNIHVGDKIGEDDSRFDELLQGNPLFCIIRLLSLMSRLGV